MTNYVDASNVHEFLDLVYENNHVSSTTTNEKGISFRIPFIVEFTKTSNGQRFRFEPKNAENAAATKLIFDNANKLIGTTGSKWKWKALVQIVNQNCNQKCLQSPITDLAGIVVTHKGQNNVRAPTQDPSLYIDEKSPVIEIVGEGDSSSQLNCKRMAMQTLHKFCSLYSVWQVATTVILEGPIDEKKRYFHAVEEGCHFEKIEGCELAPLWANLLEDECACNAAALFREAVAIRTQHKSLSYLALVSSIEAIGEKIYTPIKCSGVQNDNAIHCEKCNKQTGPSQAFQAALDLLEQSEMKRIAKRYPYSLRCKLVHTGLLHGGEEFTDSPGIHGKVSLPFGLPLTTYFDGSGFEFALSDMMKVVRELLISNKFKFDSPK